jgi:arylsulfatase A-like enzyme
MPGRATVGAAYRDCQRMITDGRWKLIVYRVAEKQRRQLFDLAHDPGEMHDLSPEPALTNLLARLQAQLEAWQVANGDRWMPVTLPA